MPKKMQLLVDETSKEASNVKVYLKLKLWFLKSALYSTLLFYTTHTHTHTHTHAYIYIYIYIYIYDKKIYIYIYMKSK